MRFSKRLQRYAFFLEYAKSAYSHRRRIDKNQEKNPTSLLDHIVYCIAQEPVSGNIWIGSRAGLSLMVEKKKGTEFINFAPH